MEEQELFDEERGLGTPYKKNKIIISNRNNGDEASLIVDYLKCIKERVDIRDIFGTTKTKSSSSLDVNFIRGKLEGKEVFVLDRTATSLSAGAYNGRFAVNNYDERLMNRKHHLEYVPADDKIRNVFFCSKKSNKNIIISGFDDGESLNLHSVFVGVGEDDKLSLFNEQGSEIFVDQGCMANPYFEDDIVRFMIQVSTNNHVFRKINYLFSLGGNFKPRLVFKNFIIAPKRWQISRAVFENDFSIEKVRNIITRVVGQKKIVLYDFDMTISLNLEKDLDCLVLSDQCKKNKVVSISEYIQPSDEKNTQVTISYVEKKSESGSIRELPANLNKRLTMIGDTSNWVSFNLYQVGELQDELLRVIINILNLEGYNVKWFFIKYWDGRDHIRLRIKCFKGKLIMDIISTFNKLITNGYLVDYSIVPYFRELERYGGIENILEVEDVFCLDSIMTVSYLSSYSVDSKESL